MAIENPTEEQIIIGFAIVRAGYLAIDDEVMSVNDKLKKIRAFERSKFKLLEMKIQTESIEGGTFLEPVPIESKTAGEDS